MEIPENNDEFFNVIIPILFSEHLPQIEGEPTGNIQWPCGCEYRLDCKSSLDRRWKIYKVCPTIGNMYEERLKEWKEERKRIESITTTTTEQ